MFPTSFRRFFRTHKQPIQKLTKAARLRLEQLEDRIVPSTLLTADKANIAPGEMATFTGSGFTAGETVQIQVFYGDGTPAGATSSWSVADGGAGDLDVVV